MEGVFDKIRNFFVSITKIIPIKSTSHVRILDSNGLIDESLQQAVEEEPKIVLRDPTPLEVTKKALTELE